MIQFRLQFIDTDEFFRPGEKLQLLQVRIGLCLPGPLEGQIYLLVSPAPCRRFPKVADVGDADGGEIGGQSS